VEGGSPNIAVRTSAGCRHFLDLLLAAVISFLAFGFLDLFLFIPIIIILFIQERGCSFRASSLLSSDPFN
jgi:hypothetical protein